MTTGFAKRYAHFIDFVDVFSVANELWFVENSEESDFFSDLQCSRASILDMAG